MATSFSKEEQLFARNMIEFMLYEKTGSDWRVYQDEYWYSMSQKNPFRTKGPDELKSFFRDRLWGRFDKCNINEEAVQECCKKLYSEREGTLLEKCQALHDIFRERDLDWNTWDNALLEQEFFKHNKAFDINYTFEENINLLKDNILKLPTYLENHKLEALFKKIREYKYNPQTRTVEKILQSAVKTVVNKKVDIHQKSTILKDQPRSACCNKEAQKKALRVAEKLYERFINNSSADEARPRLFMLSFFQLEKHLTSLYKKHNLQDQKLEKPHVGNIGASFASMLNLMDNPVKDFANVGNAFYGYQK